jgi:hypothetical protein
MPCYRAPKSAHDPLIEVAHMVAEAIVAVGGPLFWGVLGTGSLRACSGEFESFAINLRHR